MWLSVNFSAVHRLVLPAIFSTAMEDTESATSRARARRGTYTLSADSLASAVAITEGKTATTGHAKLILTSDLANTSSTRSSLKEALCALIGGGCHHKALWVHDARSGWDDTAIARAWMMDGFDELDFFQECGVTACSGLWINRDFRQEGNQMQLAMRLERSFHQRYELASVASVARVIDRASVLYLPGGNPYRLLDALRKGQGGHVWQHALSRIEAGELVLITRSAGTIVAGTTVDVSTERPADWDGDPTGLCVAPAGLAFIPHYHLPHVDWLRHSKEWRHEQEKQHWTKEDFIAALAEASARADWASLSARARLTQQHTEGSVNVADAARAAVAEKKANEARSSRVRGVPLREGWFIAFDGNSIFKYHEGPKRGHLPRAASAAAKSLEGTFWNVMLHLARVSSMAEGATRTVPACVCSRKAAGASCDQKQTP